MGAEIKGRFARKSRKQLGISGVIRVQRQMSGQLTDFPHSSPLPS